MRSGNNVCIECAQQTRARGLLTALNVCSAALSTAESAESAALLPCASTRQQGSACICCRINALRKHAPAHLFRSRARTRWTQVEGTGSPTDTPAW